MEKTNKLYMLSYSDRLALIPDALYYHCYCVCFIFFKMKICKNRRHRLRIISENPARYIIYLAVVYFLNKISLATLFKQPCIFCLCDCLHKLFRFGSNVIDKECCTAVLHTVLDRVGDKGSVFLDLNRSCVLDPCVACEYTRTRKIGRVVNFLALCCA